jgi:hypothetical protein
MLPRQLGVQQHGQNNQKRNETALTLHIHLSILLFPPWRSITGQPSVWSNFTTMLEVIVVPAEALFSSGRSDVQRLTNVRK